MGTRFYFPDLYGQNPVSPATSGTWAEVMGFERHPCYVDKQSTEFDCHGFNYQSSQLLRQYVSEQLEAQTISGNVKGQFRCRQTNVAYDVCPAIIIRVVSGDGGTVRGTLLSYLPATNEFATAYTNRNYPPSTAVDSVECQHGDRLVIEVGVCQIIAAYYPMGGVCFGDNSLSDLPEDNSDTNEYCPWVEFSQSLEFYDPLAHPCSGSVSVGVTPSSVSFFGIEKDGSIAATITPSSVNIHQAPGEFITNGTAVIAVVPSAAIINSSVCSGDVPISVAMSASVSRPDRAYNGSVTAEITVSAITGQPIIGWDSATGYGMVDISFLADDPPFFGIDAEVEIGLDNTADTFTFYAEREVAATGGIKLGGTPVYGFVTPETSDPVVDEVVPEDSCFAISGGTEKYGQPVYGFIDAGIPGTDEIVGSGGMEISAPAYPVPYANIRPISAERIFAVQSSGGLDLGGSGEPEFTQETMADLVGVGGAVIGGGVPPVVVWVEPEDTADEADTDTYMFVLGGEPVVEFVDPATDEPQEQPALERREYDGILMVGGEGGVAWVQPLVIAREGAGGMAMGGGVDVAALAHTWVLTGSGLEASFYTGFNFNSYASLNGKAYAAGAEGIYLIGGDTDGGVQIKPGLRLGPTNFMLKNRKYVRSVVLGDCGDNTQVRLFAGDKEAIADVEGGRANGSREVYDESIGIDVAGFDTLDTIDVVAVVAAHKR